MENFKPDIKFRHLENGFQPIKVCIHNYEDHQSSPFVENHESDTDYEDVDYSAETDYFKENKMYNGGFETYVISDVNSKNKYSRGMYDCTGLIVVGEDKETNENISILSHQDPKEFLTSRLFGTFKNHLTESIRKILEKSKNGSIDAIIFGGNNYTPPYGRDCKNFEKSIQLISEIIFNELNFKPTVTTGPKETNGHSDIYFDNKERRAYLFMPRQEKSLIYHDFLSDNVSEQIEKQKREKSNKIEANEDEYY